MLPPGLGVDDHSTPVNPPPRHLSTCPYPVIYLAHISLSRPHIPPHLLQSPTMNDLQPEAGPSRRVYTPSPSLSPPPSPSPPRRRKRHMSESEEDEYNPFMPSPRLYGGGKPRRQPPRRNNAPRPPDSTAPRKRVTRARARRNSSPSITASLESIASEDASVKREVQRLNLGLRDVQGDGNCLFRALADQLWGVQKRHVEVRKLVCDHLEMYKETMKTFVQPFLPDGETYDEYVLRMRQSSKCNDAR